ncbi:hypothetical protein ALC62_05378 [Cyphomyrmex costatus]|uniref:Uncharacterized protein n=1 Tax=Cyphomyrmex costatus TaxID=456900 RepID=A0A195CT34_9HYME|nr:hypothetical protein ALC62_05378 [Cyphomyrmex costatus]
MFDTSTHAILLGSSWGERRARWEISLSYSRASRLHEEESVTPFFYSSTIGFQRCGEDKIERKRNFHFEKPSFFLAGLSFGPLVNVPFGKEQKYKPTRTGRGAVHVVTFRFLTPSCRPRYDWRPLEHSYIFTRPIYRHTGACIALAREMHAPDNTGRAERDLSRITIQLHSRSKFLITPYRPKCINGIIEMSKLSQASKSATRSAENRRSIIPLVARAGRSHVRRIVRSADDEGRESFEKFADHDQLYSFALCKRVCQLACKNCHEIRGAHIPPKPLENGCPMAEMFIPRTREIWNAATCSTYVNCSAKQAAPLAFRSAPSRFTPRLHYTISNKPEYCILRSRVFRSSGFSSTRMQWNVRMRCIIFCRKICTGISVDESELLYHKKERCVEKR